MENKKEESPILLFKTKGDWEKWLHKTHAASNGIWLKFYKKGTGSVSVFNYAEALEIALCYGWIDGTAKKLDETTYIQRFTPRRPKSLWSKRNVERAERLIASGKMKSSGLKEIEAAKADGRWAAAYDAPSNAKIPEDFLKALAKNTKAHKFFQTLNKTNLFSIAWRLQTARKPETRENRMNAIIEMLSKGEKFH